MLKIKNLHIINNKQSPILNQIDALDRDDPNFESCDTVSLLFNTSLLVCEHRVAQPLLL